MTTPNVGEAVLKTYLVTVTETYRVVAEDEAAALAEVADVSPTSQADTRDVQVEVLS